MRHTWLWIKLSIPTFLKGFFQSIFRDSQGDLQGLDGEKILSSLTFVFFLPSSSILLVKNFLVIRGKANQSNFTMFLVGPALARPSDFIQSKPGKDSTEATNEDKFPYNPSVSGNQVLCDSKSILPSYSKCDLGMLGAWNWILLDFCMVFWLWNKILTKAQ